MYVAPTDADVAEARPAFEGKGLLSIFAGATPDTMLTMMQIGAAMGGVPKHVKIEPGMAPPMVPAPAFYGSPDTVNAQIAEASRVLGMGRLEISVGGVNPLAHDTMVSTLKLIGEEVVPVVHEEAW